MQPRILNNRYELLEPIGQGGMATVYRGRDTRLGRPIAVKLLHPQYVTDTQFLQRFEHEAQAAAGLSAHPNIVDVYDVGQDNGVPYIVMELITGEDLSSIIARDGPLPVDRAIRIAERAADGLDFAHQRGFVHRDVKPQNILIGPNDEVKITDFGIAKSSLSTAVTQAGMTFGTADYISPEQAQGLGATPQSDIYSLAIVVYQMLSAHLPFTGDTPMAVALQQIQQPPPPLTQWNPSIPPNLERIVLAALSKDPQQRPISAGVFAAQLRDYRSARMVQTQVAPVAPVAPTQPRRQVVAPPPPGMVTKGTTPMSTVPPPPVRRVVPQVAPPLRAAPTRQSSFPFGALLLGLLLLGGLLALAYVAFATDTFQRLFAGSPPSPTVPAFTNPTPTPAPSATPAVMVEIPNFVGHPESDVRERLVAAGLVPDLPDAPRTDPVYPRGTVVEQRPAPGSRVPKGGKVYLRISLGQSTATAAPATPVAPTATVPPPPQPTPTAAALALTDLAGQDGDTVLAALTAAGFRANPIRQPSTVVAGGRVISQEPAAGRYPPDTIVTLRISQGDVVPFPNAIGLDLTPAEQAIRATPDLVLDVVDFQGRDRLPNYDQLRPNQVISATADGKPIQNGSLVPRTAHIVLGVRKP